MYVKCSRPCLVYLRNCRPQTRMDSEVSGQWSRRLRSRWPDISGVKLLKGFRFRVSVLRKRNRILTPEHLILLQQ